MRGGTRLAMHVKELGGTATPAQRVPAWLQSMASLRRGVVVGLDRSDLPAGGRLGRPTAAARAQLGQFLRRGSIGDVLAIPGRDTISRDAHALLRILGPVADSHGEIEFVQGASADPFLDAARIRRLLDRAFAQFMPRMANVIALFGPHDRAMALDIALHGRPMERWDRFPRRGERVAVGRSDDGFWARDSRPESAGVLWVPTTGKRGEREPILIERRASAARWSLAQDQFRLLHQVRGALSRQR